MSDYKRLSPNLAVAGQIQPGQLEDIARQGFHTVINNRPDGEGDDQPTSDALKQAARAAGLAYYHLPVTPGEISDTDILGFAGLMQQSRGPVLAFCRTGNRSKALSEYLAGQAGFTNVANVENGITSWISEGGDVSEASMPDNCWLC